MKVRVDRAKFAEEIKFVSQFLPRKAYAPRDATIRLEMDGGGLLRLSCTDGVSWATSTVSAIGEAGSAAVAGRLLAEVASSLPTGEDDVRMEVELGRLWLYCGAASFRLGVMEVEWTAPPTLRRVGLVEALPFVDAVKQVSVSVSRDESRPTLCGVYAEIDGSTLTLVSTDSYRMTWRTLEWTSDIDGFAATALIPAAAVEEAAKFLADRTEIDVCLADERNMVGFTDWRRRITTRLIDGQYVNWRRLFESDSEPLLATVDVRLLADAVKRVSLVADKATPVRLTFGDDTVLVEASGDDGEAREYVPAKLGFDTEFVIGFNPRYLLDALGSVPATAAEISMWQPTKPVIMRGVDVDNFRHLLMPMRLDGK